MRLLEKGDPVKIRYLHGEWHGITVSNAKWVCRDLRFQKIEVFLRPDERGISYKHLNTYPQSISHKLPTLTFT